MQYLNSLLESYLLIDENISVSKKIDENIKKKTFCLDAD